MRDGSFPPEFRQELAAVLQEGIDEFFLDLKEAGIPCPGRDLGDKLGILTEFIEQPDRNFKNMDEIRQAAIAFAKRMRFLESIKTKPQDKAVDGATMEPDGPIADVKKADTEPRYLNLIVDFEHQTVKRIGHGDEIDFGGSPVIWHTFRVFFAAKDRTRNSMHGRTVILEIGAPVVNLFRT